MLTQFSSKLPSTGTSIFTRMSSLAQKAKAINLSQGFPDFQCDSRLIDLVSTYMKRGKNQYAPMAGLPFLKEEIASLLLDSYGAEIDPETELSITCGATEALFSCLTAFIRNGDEVITLEPAYDAYLPAIQLNGGIAKPIPLTFPDYKIDWDRLKAAINPKTKAILINNPHNPSGATLDSEDLAELEKIVLENNILILSDEVYEFMTYDEVMHHSLLRYPVFRGKSVVISSFGKSLHTTGWKIGYAIATPELSKEIRKVHQFVTFSVSTPFQYAIAEYLSSYRDELKTLAGFYQRKRDLFRGLLSESQFDLLDCKGAYFQLAQYNQISDMPDTEFSEWLTREIKVACIPVSAFYHDATDHGVVRFCFAKEDETLEAAAKLLRAL